MKLLLSRKFKGDKYTIGDLFINGMFFCNTIEDTVRVLPATCPNTPKGLQCKCKEKVYAETAIPAGTYKITMELSPRFGKVLPLLYNVPHFMGVLMHAGNSENDSSGCLIVGLNTEKGKVLQSRITLEKLLDLMRNQKDIIIQII